MKTTLLQLLLASGLFLFCYGTPLLGTLALQDFTASTHDRYANDPAFTGSGFDWTGSGIENGGSRRWATMISSTYFLSAYHAHPTIGNDIVFHVDNDPAGTTVSRTVISITRISSSDLVIGKLDSAPGSSIAIYGIAFNTTTPLDFTASTYSGRTAFVVGRNTSSNTASFRLGRNVLDGFSTHTEGGSTGDLITFNDDRGTVDSLGVDEAFLQSGDSGAPLFITSGSDLVLTGIHWTILPDSGPSYSGSTFIPNHITEIQNIVETAGESLTLINIPLPGETTGPFTSELFTYTVTDEKVTITDYPTAAEGSINIPSAIDGKAVIAIANSAFSYCSKITELTIPNNVHSIGHSAFSYCSSLTSITLPNSLTNINSSLFYHCSALTNLTLPAKISTIDTAAFQGCHLLTEITIPENVTQIGQVAFNNCIGLTTLTIPKNVTTLGRGAFINCINLTHLEVHPENPHFSALGGVLFNSDFTTLIVYPCGHDQEYTIPDGVSSIEEYAFRSCAKLKTISIHSDVTSIGRGAFSGCQKLTTIQLPQNISRIEDFTFYSCHQLTTFFIPNGVSSIGDNAFSFCKELISISIPNSVTSIGKKCFQNCTRLTDIQLSKNISILESDLFFGCSSLRKIDIPHGVNSLGNKTFFNCFKLSNITLPNSITHIGISCFEGCISLTDIGLPNKLSTIEKNAFEGCLALTSVTIPSSLTQISSQAFNQCSKLASIYFLGDAPTLGYQAVNLPSFDFKYYYLSSSAGFTSPKWEGRPAIKIDETTYPAAAWLLYHQLPYDSDLAQSTTSDGTRLLYSYAFNLAPNKSPAEKIPRTTLTRNDLFISFSDKAQGINYTIESSEDLIHWSSEDVMLSRSKTTGFLIGFIKRTHHHQFLRINVQLN